jgi:deferrochelatase/peroxidase EfeB
MTQHLVTIVVPFEGNVPAVEAHLQTWGNPAGSAGSVPGTTLARALDELGAVHFMGVHAIAGEQLTNHLVFELAVDGSTTYVLEQIERTIGSHIVQLLNAANCTPTTPLAAFLGQHCKELGLGWFSGECGLGFQGTPGFSVARIRAEARLAREVTAWMDSIPADWPARKKLEYVRARVWSDAGLKWAFEEQPCLAANGGGGILRAVLRGLGPAVRELLWPFMLPLLLGSVLGWVLGGPAVAAGVLLLLGTIEALLAVFAYRRLRQYEENDPEDLSPQSRSAAAELLEIEDKAAQNHLIVLTKLKPGRLRRIALRLGFLAVRQGVQDVFAPGKLADIGTIHVARWIVLPRTSQLLFLSNYDGSWESYLEDFISKAHEGLTGIWSNTEGFPKAKNLFELGATHGGQFKTWARRRQQPTRFWYSAYPQLTAARIRTNAAIRQGIADVRSDADIARWVALFGAPSNGLETESVPALVFGGVSRALYSKAVLFRFERGGELKAWLNRVYGLVSHGEHPERREVLSLGFSAQGLEKLGLSKGTMATFPVAFLHDSALRARALGDAGHDAPKRWLWGGSQTVDAIVVLHASTQDKLDELTRRVHDSAFAFRHEIVCDAAGRGSSNRREAFGFVDGIGQPTLRGTARAAGAKHPDQLLATGEIVLGYEDESTFLPPSPKFTAADGAGTRQLRVDSDPGCDLGRNGTFLVVRQLQQDVRAFQEFVREQSTRAEVQAAIPQGVAATTWVAAKMLGRWPNGTSLVRYPAGPGPNSDVDNDFRYADDPNGVACPMGAHIRRANPRDSFDPTASEPLKIVNRHRILRVGRSYTADDKKGLMFMCLNADIERQFEFIQRTWLRGPSFSGLPDEVDPIQGQQAESGPHGCAAAVMTIPTASGPVRLKGLRDFIRVVGSGYFFMPGRECLHSLAASANAATQACQSVQQSSAAE